MSDNTEQREGCRGVIDNFLNKVPYAAIPFIFALATAYDQATTTNELLESMKFGGVITGAAIGVGIIATITSKMKEFKKEDLNSGHFLGFIFTGVYIAYFYNKIDAIESEFWQYATAFIATIPPAILLSLYKAHKMKK